MTNGWFLLWSKINLKNIARKQFLILKNKVKLAFRGAIQRRPRVPTEILLFLASYNNNRSKKVVPIGRLLLYHFLFLFLLLVIGQLLFNCSPTSSNAFFASFSVIPIMFGTSTSCFSSSCSLSFFISRYGSTSPSTCEPIGAATPPP